MLKRLAMRSLAFAVLVFAGCGARTTLDLDVGEDASVSLPDAANDAGRDAGFDAGPPELACRSDSDCAGSICRASRRLRPADLAPLPLACGTLDPLAAVGEPCRARDECDRGLCAVAGACLRPCASDFDCDAGERCREVFVQTAAQALQPLPACVPVVTAPPDVRVAGPEPGPSIPNAFETGTDTLGSLEPAAHLVWLVSDGSFPFLQRIFGRDGTLVFDAFSTGLPDSPTPLWGVGAATITDMITVLYPNGPNTPRRADGFLFELSAMNGAASSERVLMHRMGEGTVIDIDAYLVGGGRWTSPDGEPPAPLRRAIEDARALYATVGITIGELRVHEIVGELRDRYSILEGFSPQGAPEELDDLYRMSAGARRPSVHVFLVREIELALGIASGIPGPHAMPGTGASGVAIAADLVTADELGVVIVHEIGHYMGLFHTSELDGSVNDPFPDTGECRTNRDGNGDGMLLPDECFGAGADNIMFWAGIGPALSPQQGEVMRRAFFVR